MKKYFFHTFFVVLTIIFILSIVACRGKKGEINSASESANFNLNDGTTENTGVSSFAQNGSSNDDKQIGYAYSFTGDLENNVTSEWISTATLTDGKLSGVGLYIDHRRPDSLNLIDSGTKITINNIKLGPNGILKRTVSWGDNGIWAYFYSGEEKLGVIFAYYTGNGYETFTVIALGQKAVSELIESKAYYYLLDFSSIDLTDISNTYHGFISSNLETHYRFMPEH